MPWHYLSRANLKYLLVRSSRSKFHSWILWRRLSQAVCSALRLLVVWNPLTKTRSKSYTNALVTVNLYTSNIDLSHDPMSYLAFTAPIHHHVMLGLWKMYCHELTLFTPSLKLSIYFSTTCDLNLGIISKGLLYISCQKKKEYCCGREAASNQIAKVTHGAGSCMCNTHTASSPMPLLSWSKVNLHVLCASIHVFYFWLASL